MKVEDLEGEMFLMVVQTAFKEYDQRLDKLTAFMKLPWYKRLFRRLA